MDLHDSSAGICRHLLQYECDEKVKLDTEFVSSYQLYGALLQIHRALWGIYRAVLRLYRALLLK